MVINKNDERIERLSTLSSDIDNLINRNQQLEKQVNDLTLWFALAILNTPDAKLDFMKSNPCVQQWVKDGYLDVAIDGNNIHLLKSDNWNSGATVVDEADLKTIRGNND